MSGNKLFVDTNILIYLLEGDDRIAKILEGKDIHISFITEIELLSYHRITKAETKILKELISDFRIISMNNQIKESCIEIRKNYKLKLPDSIIAASVDYFNMPFLTADDGFNKITALDIVIYES